MDSVSFCNQVVDCGEKIELLVDMKENLQFQVNQKMVKTTLIKDLYGEIERLKAEVYAMLEKNGVYIPKERYYQEELERNVMDSFQISLCISLNCMNTHGVCI
ncbi:hypothetical protein L1987_45878 [Smallanthus sonchifolius]|uniref:Uncharacterized protein n=1 Tax=Smallanthus sonchifolius TaxID=185202 RepID=A0ACB9FYE1_9ASTR|nr:hypothetical protein L1987_45878 [Smallanthus sonchifolius]